MSHPTPPAAAPMAPPINPGTGANDVIVRLERERRYCLKQAQGGTEDPVPQGAPYTPPPEGWS